MGEAAWSAVGADGAAELGYERGMMENGGRVGCSSAHSSTWNCAKSYVTAARVSYGK